MDPNVRIKRHSLLWEAGTSRISRTAISGVIFAVLILIKVVAPEQTNKDQEQLLKNLGDREAEISALQNQLENFRSTLDEIEAVIVQAPWDVKKDDLIEFFVRRKNEGNLNSGESQDEADETIIEITEGVRKDIVKPLKEATAATTGLEELATYPNSIDAAITSWKNEHHGNREWYATLGSKARTMDQMSTLLSKIENDAAEAVGKIEGEINSQIEEVKTDKKNIQANIESAETRKKAALNQILPSWATDLISVKNMMVLYPWILVAIAVFFVGNGLIAARHFDGMADEEKWSAAERSDPLLSSPWTLTWRGVAGTAFTLVLYLAVLAVLAYCLYRSLNPPVTTVASVLTDPTDAAAAASSNLPIELAYGLFVAAFLLVVITPWRRWLNKS